MKNAFKEIPCQKCKGQGIWPPKNVPGNYPRIVSGPCSNCNGTGKIRVE